MTEQEQNSRPLVLRNLHIDKTWTLFLDRDGVINERIQGSYVREWTQFVFLQSAIEAIRELSAIFGIIIVVTNQRGIARNLILEDDLCEIHAKMVDIIRRNGGRIDRVYVCPHELQDQCTCRKPKTGLALQARSDFPSIVFSKSVMVGDDVSDILFAKAMKMKSILLVDGGNDRDEILEADCVFKNLFEFAMLLKREAH